MKGGRPLKALLVGLVILGAATIARAGFASRSVDPFAPGLTDVTQEAEACFDRLGYDVGGRLIVGRDADGSILYRPVGESRGPYLVDALEPKQERAQSMTPDESITACTQELKGQFGVQETPPAVLSPMPPEEASALRGCLAEAGALSKLSYLSLQIDEAGFPAIEFRHQRIERQEDEDAIADAVGICTAQSVQRLKGHEGH